MIMHLLGNVIVMIIGGLYLFITTLFIYSLGDGEKAKLISPFIGIVIAFALFNIPFGLICSGFFLSAGLGYDSHVQRIEMPITTSLRLIINIISIICIIAGIILCI